MRQTDKFLLAIVGSVVILIAAAFALILLRPEPQYRSDDSPEAAVHNYLLALQQEAYERALDEISHDVPNRPQDGNEMEWAISQNSWQFDRYGDPALVISSSRVSGDHATVTLAETRSGGIFPGDVSSQEIVMRLKQDENGWKLIGGKAYWSEDWEE